MRTQVIKFGGSLCQTLEIVSALRWLQQTAKGHPTLIVPGGGAYADVVKSVQDRLQVDEATAHRQALIAMEQTAHLIQALAKAHLGVIWPLVEAPSEGIAIWTPRAWLWDDTLPTTWDLSSDSLALILATRVNAYRLILMKSLEEHAIRHAVDAWVEAGWVDPLFATYSAHFRGEIRLVGRTEWGK